MAAYTLPDLSYDYGALDPHISGRIMELHHSKHHAAYVGGANTALEKLAEARDKGAYDTVNLLEKNLAFNLGGHVNHVGARLLPRLRQRQGRLRQGILEHRELERRRRSSHACAHADRGPHRGQLTHGS